jgi:hypothetical protein
VAGGDKEAEEINFTALSSSESVCSSRVDRRGSLVFLMKIYVCRPAGKKRLPLVNDVFFF